MTTLSTKRAGHQFVGVGVGAIVFDAMGQVFLAKRGQEASNDQGLWAWPGGEVEFGETLIMAIRRELLEEFDIVIEPLCQIAAFDHMLEGGQEHWVSVPSSPSISQESLISKSRESVATSAGSLLMPCPQL